MADKVKNYLGKQIRITINDGRIIIGRFYCLDYQCNIIVDQATEDIIPTSTNISTPLRHLGMVIIPHQHLVKCELAVN